MLLSCKKNTSVSSEIESTNNNYVISSMVSVSIAEDQGCDTIFGGENNADMLAVDFTNNSKQQKIVNVETLLIVNQTNINGGSVNGRVCMFSASEQDNFLFNYLPYYYGYDVWWDTLVPIGTGHGDEVTINPRETVRVWYKAPIDTLVTSGFVTFQLKDFGIVGNPFSQTVRLNGHAKKVLPDIKHSTIIFDSLVYPKNERETAKLSSLFRVDFQVKDQDAWIDNFTFNSSINNSVLTIVNTDTKEIICKVRDDSAFERMDRFLTSFQINKRLPVGKYRIRVNSYQLQEKPLLYHMDIYPGDMHIRTYGIYGNRLGVKLVNVPQYGL